MRTAVNNFRKIALFPLLVYTANEISCRFFSVWYANNSVDTFFHFLGGLSIAYSFNWILIDFEKLNFIKIKNILLRIFFIGAAVALAAVLWEIYEFLWDLKFNTVYQPSNADTVKDLIMGLLGGFSFCLVFFRDATGR